MVWVICYLTLISTTKADISFICLTWVLFNNLFLYGRTNDLVSTSFKVDPGIALVECQVSIGVCL